MKTRNTPTLLVPKQPVIQEGVVRHRPLPEPDLREAALAWAEEAAVVVVHCTIPPVADSEDYFIRRRTYLADANTGRRFRLLHAEGIAHPPYRSASRPGTAFQFTLHFEALPGTCTVFSLVERSPHQFPFVVHGLERNRMDVYRVTLVE